MERKKKQRSLWKATAEKEAAKLLSNMNVEQLRQQVTKLEEKEKEQRERMQLVYQSHLAHLTKAFSTLLEQKENIKYITKYAQSLSLFCQQWNEQQTTGQQYCLGVNESARTDKHDDDLQQREEESKWNKLEQSKEDLSFMLESLEQAIIDLEDGNFLDCQLRLFTWRQRKEQLEQRLALTTEPLQQFLSSLWDSQESLSNRLEKKVSEWLETSANLDPSTGFICCLLLLKNNEKLTSLEEKCQLFLDLRYRCLSLCLSALSDRSSSLEQLEAVMNCVVTTLLTYDKFLQELRTPTLIIPNLGMDQLDSQTPVLHFLHQQPTDHSQYLDQLVGEWLQRVNQETSCNLENWLKQVVTEQNMEKLSHFSQSILCQLDSLSMIEEEQNKTLKEQVENLKRIWTVSFMNCVHYLFESTWNVSFTKAEECIGNHMETIMKENISTLIQMSSYWKYVGDWSAMFWMYIDQENNEHRKTFTRSLLDSDKCTWEVWMDEFLIKDANISNWYDSLIEHLQQLFHQTFPFLLSLLGSEEKQTILERIHKQILQRHSQFFKFLEEKIDLLLPSICPLCDKEEWKNSNSQTKQDFVLSGLLYLYRCVRLLRHGNLLPSSIIELGADLVERDIEVVEQKCRYHLIHHIIYLSMIRTLKTHSLVYCSLQVMSLDESSPTQFKSQYYPSELLIRWFLELGKYTQIVDMLHFPGDMLQVIRLLTCSHFMKWLQCFQVIENLKDGKITNRSVIVQLYTDLVWMGDICLSRQDTTDKDWNVSIHAKWEEYMATVETFLSNQSLPSDWKQQIHFSSSCCLNRMRHLFGRLSIPSNEKQETNQKPFMETYSSPILSSVGRFPYLPAPTPSLLNRHRNKRLSENKLLDSLETKTSEQISSNMQNQQRKENTSVVDFASQFVGQQMGRFSLKFLESLRTYGGTTPP